MAFFQKPAVAFMLSLILTLSFSGCAETQSKEAEPLSSSQGEQSSQTTENSSEPTVSKMEDLDKSSSEFSSSIDQSELQSSSSISSFLDQHDFCIDELTRKQRVRLKQYAHSIKIDSENWDWDDENWDKRRNYKQLLKIKLDPNDYLGFNYDFKSVGFNYECESCFIIIKVVNLDNVRAVINSYPSDTIKVLYEKVEYSLADLKAMEQEFKEQPFYKNNPSSIHTNIKETGIIEYQIDNMYPELDQWLEDSEYGDLFIEVDGSEKTNPA